METTGTNMRVMLLSLRTQHAKTRKRWVEPRLPRNVRLAMLPTGKQAKQYYVNLQLLPFNRVARTLELSHDPDGSSTSDYAGRTEVSSLSNAPKFVNHSFMFKCSKAAGSLGVMRVQLYAAVSGGAASGWAHKPKFSLLARSDVPLNGDSLRRLVRGDHVQLSAKFSELKGAEAELEVLLVDAPGVVGGSLGVPLVGQPASRGRSAASTAPRGTGGGGGGGSAQSHGGASGAASLMEGQGGEEVAEVTVLSVFVASAAHLPSVQGDAPEQAVPNVFVALKSARQAAAKMPAQASTAPVRSNNPTWNHLLAVEMHSDELPEERLLLAMVNADTNKLLAKASLPMKALRPGRHYNLRLLLESPVAGAATPSLDVTLHVHSTPRAALQWAALHPDAVHVEAGVVAVQGAAEDAEAQKASTQVMAPVMAMWSLIEDVDAAGLSLLPSTHPVFAPADASDEEALHAVLTELNADTSFDSYPVLTSLAGAPLFPEGHTGTLFLSQETVDAYPNPGVMVEFHKSSAAQVEGTGSTLVGRAAMPFAMWKSDGSVEARKSPGQSHSVAVELLSSASEGATVDMTLAVWPPQAFLEQMEAEVMAAQLGEGGGGGGGHLDGGEGGAGFGRDTEGAVGGKALVAPAVAERLEVLCDDMRIKQAALEELFATSDTAMLQLHDKTEHLAEKTSKMAQLESDVTSLRRMLHEDAEGSAGSSSRDSLQKLSKDELVAKLLESSTRQQATSRQNSELINRLQALHAHAVKHKETQAAYVDLQEAHQQLSLRMRKMEELCAKVPKYKDTIRSQEGVIKKLERVLEKEFYSRADAPGSPVRSAELAPPPRSPPPPSSPPKSSLAGSVLDGGEDLEAKLKNQAKELEQAKQQTARAKQDAEGWKKRVQELEAERDEKESGKEELEEKVDELEEEKTGLLMRAEAAETKAKAANNQLQEAAKRNARQLAELKTKLAEKDAQLMGGFGDFSKMDLDAMPKASKGGGGGGGGRAPPAAKGGSRASNAVKMPPLGNGGGSDSDASTASESGDDSDDSR